MLYLLEDTTMSILMEIIEDDNRSFYHLNGLRLNVCNELERLNEKGDCPTELWQTYSNFIDD